MFYYMQGFYQHLPIFWYIDCIRFSSTHSEFQSTKVDFPNMPFSRDTIQWSVMVFGQGHRIDAHKKWFQYSIWKIQNEFHEVLYSFWLWFFFIIGMMRFWMTCKWDGQLHRDLHFTEEFIFVGIKIAIFIDFVLRVFWSTRSKFIGQLTTFWDLFHVELIEFTWIHLQKINEIANVALNLLVVIDFLNQIQNFLWTKANLCD